MALRSRCIENSSSARFNVVNWKAGQVNTTTFGKPYNSSVLPNCATNGAVAPCEYSVQYSSKKSASISAPFVDYAAGDTAYVTDDAVWSRLSILCSRAANRL